MVLSMNMMMFLFESKLVCGIAIGFHLIGIMDGQAIREDVVFSLHS